MKNKIIISAISVVCIFLIVGIVLFMLRGKSIYSTITLDINPSIEINLDKDEKIINVKALNDDAKEIVSDELDGMDLEEAIHNIVDKVIEKGYVSNNQVII